jgi:hypothetical protein
MVIPQRFPCWMSSGYERHSGVSCVCVCVCVENVLRKRSKRTRGEVIIFSESSHLPLHAQQATDSPEVTSEKQR